MGRRHGGKGAGRSQPVNQAQNFSEQGSGDSNFRELKGDITAMTHDLGADLDELVAQGGERPVFLASGRCYAASGSARVCRKLPRL